MEGLPEEKANALTEKICGICSNAHTWNSVMVAEKGLNIDVPERANYIRVIMGELERLHSHLLYLAHGNEVLGHETFAMRIFYIRETVMELLNMIGGNRVQYGVSVIGGLRPRCQLDDMRIQRLNEGMDKLEKDLTKFTDRFTSDPIVNSRIEGIGILPPKQAKKLGVTGPSLRACGFEYDLRTEMEEYDDFDLMLRILQQKGAKPLFVLIPANGRWADYAGFSPQERKDYYFRIRSMIQEKGFTVADFSSKEYEPYFMQDTWHLGPKGWAEVDKAIEQYLLG